MSGAAIVPAAESAPFTGSTKMEVFDEAGTGKDGSGAGGLVRDGAGIVVLQSSRFKASHMSTFCCGVTSEP